MKINFKLKKSFIKTNYAGKFRSKKTDEAWNAASSCKNEFGKIQGPRTFTSPL